MKRLAKAATDEYSIREYNLERGSRMIQKKFLCKDFEAVQSAVSEIAGILSGTPHKSALVTFYENGLSAKEVKLLSDNLCGLGHPELRVAGISITVVAELIPEDGTGTLLNLILTDKADIEVVSIPCVLGEEKAAAGVLRSYLDSHGSAKAVELMCGSMALGVTEFMEQAMMGHEDVVLFGTTTIRGMKKAANVVDSESIIEVESIESETDKDELVVAGSELIDGIVAVVFEGEELKVRANYALGWNPIGRKLLPELGGYSVMGETMITSINGSPAVDIFRQYLGVYPDSFFINNVCEFPFIVERDGINICMVPLDCGDNGEIYYMLKLRPEDKLRFSFASHDEVLQASLESLIDMESFEPEALFLTLCGNRINFLKEDAHIEWDSYNTIAPDYVLMHGAGELYYYEGKGGILNSAHLAVGMREAEESQNKTVYEHPTVESLRHERALSLSDRMSTFLGKITSELIDMATQAKEANNAKSAFLSHMSHEIRTPINAMLGMDEMIIKESKEPDTLDYADSILSAGNNLLGIVNDILDFSKIEAGKMSIIPDQYELISVVKDMYNVVRLRAQSKGLKVELDVDPMLPAVLYGDSSRIKQVISNILTNAVKYTEEGKVTLVLKKVSDGTASEESDEEQLKKACPGGERPDKSIRLGVSVRDTGIGIKSEDMENLFDEYERFDEKRNQKIEGTGLGLSITRELLDLMGSRLTVKSTYGEGSEFGFEIMQCVVNAEPFGDLEGRLKKPVSEKKRISFTAEDAHILVVDDTPINLRVITKLLKNTKIQIDTVTSGKDAVRLVKERTYDVVFLDHLMPEMDGPETLKRMNELEDNASAGAPVISLTSNALENAKEEYLKLGFKDYLSKPIRPEELEDMLFYYIPSEKIRTV